MSPSFLLDARARCVGLCAVIFFMAATAGADPDVDRAVELLKARRTAEAIPLLDAVIAARPDSAVAFLQRGRARAILRQPELAEADYTEAIRLQPTLASPWYERAE